MTQKERNSNLSDKQLIELFQKTGSTEYLGIVYSRYIHLIYGVCLKYLKERESSRDAVMDIFESLLSKMEGQEIRDFGKWIYVVAKNHCLMRLRKREIVINNENAGHFIMESAEIMHLYNEETLSENKIKKLEAGVDELPLEQKICIRLFYYEEKSYSQIAAETGYDLKKVKSYVQNGKRNLKIWMENKSERK
jgi:RNA polymerase sigma-70 factor (ECF subfamily)